MTLDAPDLTDAIDKRRQQVAIMFSGGTDSMLAAAIGAETFGKVHLLTYHVAQMANWEKSRKAARRLIERYGEEKIVHRIIDNDGLFRKLYFGRYWQDLRHYGLYIHCTVCMSCGLAFRVRSVVYCRTYGVRYMWDGLQNEGASEHVYPILNQERQQVVVDFCREFGVIKESPVYDIGRTDHILFEMGMTARKQLKLRALGDSDMREVNYREQLEEWLDTQADCVGNVIGLPYLVGAFIPLYGAERNKEYAYRYHTERIAMARDLLNRYFAGEKMLFLDF